jgi:hypothetical protein
VGGEGGNILIYPASKSVAACLTTAANREAAGDVEFAASVYRCDLPDEHAAFIDIADHARA